MKISAIIPCLNEEKNIAIAYQRITRVLDKYDDYEIIFIDDGSTDNSLMEMKQLAKEDRHVKYISFTKNFGLECAFRYGFLSASYEWCIQYDADLQFPPEETEKLIKKADEGNDIVFGIRTKRSDHYYRVIGSKIQQSIATNIFKIKLPKGASVFRLVKTDIAKKVINYPARTLYFIATVPLVTLKYAMVEVEHHPRMNGKTNWKFRKMLSHSNELFFGYSSQSLNLSLYLFLLNSLVFIGMWVHFYFNQKINNTIFLLFVSLLSFSHFFSKIISDQYLKYSNQNNDWKKNVFIKETNIKN